MEKIKITSEFIKLDQFLKWSGVADSGVMGKQMVLDGMVKVNGEVELRRGKKLYPGYIVEALEQKYIVE